MVINAYPNQVGNVEIPDMIWTKAEDTISYSFQYDNSWVTYNANGSLDIDTTSVSIGTSSFTGNLHTDANYMSK